MKRALLLIVAIAAFVSAVSAWDIGDARQPPLSQMFLTPQTMSGGPLSAAETGMGVGGQLAELSTLGFSTYTMNTADDIGHVMPLPYNLDTTYDIACRVFYTTDSADADNPMFKVWMEEKPLGTAFEVQTALADTFVVGTADSTTTQYGHNHTDWMVLDADALGSYNNTTMVQIAVELQAIGGAGADELSFIGLQLVWLDKTWRYDKATYRLQGGTYLTRDKGGALSEK
jgi:hypothetical protein